MGLFDFFKKKELAEIQRLNSELNNCNNVQHQLEKDLKRYSSIQDIEKEVKSINEDIEKKNLIFKT